VEVLDGQAMKLSCLGDVVIIVSPSRPQFVVVAVDPNVNDLYDCVPLLSMLRYTFEPFALLRAIVLPRVKRPEEASGPRTGVPPA
jgi:hypothetical protein